jgi:hypothetical protein
MSVVIYSRVPDVDKHTHTHTHTLTHKHTQTHTQTNIHTYAHMRTKKYTDMMGCSLHPCPSTCLKVCGLCEVTDLCCVSEMKNADTYTRTHIYTYLHTDSQRRTNTTRHIHRHMHMHTNTLKPAHMYINTLKPTHKVTQKQTNTQTNEHTNAHTHITRRAVNRHESALFSGPQHRVLAILFSAISDLKIKSHKIIIDQQIQHEKWLRII